jgi:hypothetical protein
VVYISRTFNLISTLFMWLQYNNENEFRFVFVLLVEKTFIFISEWWWSAKAIQNNSLFFLSLIVVHKASWYAWLGADISQFETNFFSSFDFTLKNIKRRAKSCRVLQLESRESQRKHWWEFLEVILIDKLIFQPRQMMINEISYENILSFLRHH